MNIKNKLEIFREAIARRFKKDHVCTCHRYDDIDNNDSNYDEDTGLEFVWGVKSISDYYHDYACSGSLNDIDIVFDRNNETYYLNLLTDRVFEKDKKDEVKFLKRVLEEFTDFMKDHDYDTEQKLPFAFNHIGTVMDFTSDNLPELYTKFKVFVSGFVAVYG